MKKLTDRAAEAALNKLREALAQLDAGRASASQLLLSLFGSTFYSMLPALLQQYAPKILKSKTLLKILDKIILVATGIKEQAGEQAR